LTCTKWKGFFFIEKPCFRPILKIVSFIETALKNTNFDPWSGEGGALILLFSNPDKIVNIPTIHTDFASPKNGVEIK
jgi:hypothetical protein